MLLEGFDAYGENKTLVDSNSCQCKDVRLLLMLLHVKSLIAFHLRLQETHNVERIIPLSIKAVEGYNFNFNSCLVVRRVTEPTPPAPPPSAQTPQMSNSTLTNIFIKYLNRGTEKCSIFCTLHAHLSRCDQHNEQSNRSALWSLAILFTFMD